VPLDLLVLKEQEVHKVPKGCQVLEVQPELKALLDPKVLKVLQDLLEVQEHRDQEVHKEHKVLKARLDLLEPKEQ
jgi:hypothetical protein